MVRLVAERSETGWTGFDPGFERPAYLATLKSSERTKQFVYGWQYIYICNIFSFKHIWIEHVVSAYSIEGPIKFSYKTFHFEGNEFRKVPYIYQVLSALTGAMFRKPNYETLLYKD